MNISKDSRLYAYLAAACFFAEFISYFSYTISYVLDDNAASFLLIIASVMWVAFSVALLFRNEIGLLVAMALNVLFYICRFFGNLSISNFLDLAASVLLIAIALSILMNKSSLSQLWFLPIILYVLSAIIHWVSLCHTMMDDYYCTLSEIFVYDFLSFDTILTHSVVPIIAYSLTCLWLKVADHPILVISSKPTPATPVNRPTQPDAVNRLKEYSSLLDCGAITEEEFQEKKKEILGL